MALNCNGEMCSKPRGATSQYLDGLATINVSHVDENYKTYHLRRLFGGLLSTGDFDLDLAIV